jgi:hypothetical protein
MDVVIVSLIIFVSNSNLVLFYYFCIFSILDSKTCEERCWDLTLFSAPDQY